MKKYINEGFPHFIHGADYNPEQWIATKEIWDEDMKLMREANCNEMTVGIFSWSNLEPREGEYDFSFLDEIIERVYAAGGRVVLATPSGARTHWLADKYPEVLRVDKNGVRARYGARHNHCYTSPAYREKVSKINKLLSERYGKHPAVLAWHLSNEYGGECYCPLCVEAFRNFLREKYENDIEKLNFAYWTSFWSHKYDSFEQVEPPFNHGETGILGLNLDWKRFVTRQTKDFMIAEIQAIRAGGSELPVTTNMMQNYPQLDYAELAEPLDVISWDSYPDWNGKGHFDAMIGAAFWHDFFRSLKKRPHMLMESAPGLVNWKEINKLKRPGMDTLASLQAVAHGSDSVQYFQFRKGRGGFEKWHGAVVDHVGTSETRVFKAVQKTGEILQKIDEIAGSAVRSKAAVVFDWENLWALEEAQGFQNSDKKYMATCMRYYQALHNRCVSVDVVNARADWSGYDLVVAPMLYSIGEETAEKIRSFVERGGTFYATYALGMVNETDLCYLDGFPCGKLKEVFGIWNEEIDTLYPDERGEVEMGGKKYETADYSERIHLRGATCLATYAKDFYAGEPALTVNAYGKGKAYYQAFRDTGALTDETLYRIVKELKIPTALPKPQTLPLGVTAHIREDEENEYLFLQNFSENRAENISLGKTYEDMLTGEKISVASLDGYSCRVLKAKK